MPRYQILKARDGEDRFYFVLDDAFDVIIGEFETVKEAKEFIHMRQSQDLVFFS